VNRTSARLISIGQGKKINPGGRDIVGDVGIFFAGLKNNLCVIHNVPMHCCREHF
jgi:hypothetical protein